MRDVGRARVAGGFGAGFEGGREEGGVGGVPHGLLTLGNSQGDEWGTRCGIVEVERGSEAKWSKSAQGAAQLETLPRCRVASQEVQTAY